MCVACLAAMAPFGGGAATSFQGGPFPGERGPLPPPERGPLGGTLRWTGVAGLRLEVDGHGVAFDPFVSRPGLFRTLFRRARPDAGLVQERFSDLDAVFFGHTHYDHAMDLPAVAAASPRATLYGGRDTVELATRLGIPARRLVVVGDGDRVTVGPLVVEAIRSEHGLVPWIRHVDRTAMPRKGVPRTPFRYPRGDVFAWRVEVRDLALHVQGSAGIDDEALARQSPVHALFACLAARKGTSRYLERLGERLRPRILVPLHHDDFFRPLSEPPRPVATLDWPGFLREARALEDAWGTRLFCPARDVAIPL
jgi:L-ascorbate metabolism protein UlaG (beta-lactamase superfamily)